MLCMFKWCESLTNIDLTNFNTKNVRDMRDMFNGCKSLTNLNLSSFNTLKVRSMEYMFYGCKSSKNVEQIKTNDERIIDEFKSCIIF